MVYKTSELPGFLLRNCSSDTLRVPSSGWPGAFEQRPAMSPTPKTNGRELFLTTID
jgi:hypothetical protein